MSHAAKKMFLSGLVILCTCLAAGCDSGGSGSGEPGGQPSVPDSAVAHATIGAEGGSLSVTEGELAGVHIEIPAGALAEEAQILVFLGNLSFFHGGFAAGPAVTLPVDVSLLPTGSSVDDLRVQHIYSLDGAVLRDTLTPTAIDAAAGTITVAVTHFSDFVPFVEHAPVYAWGRELEGIDDTLAPKGFYTDKLAGAVKIADCFHSVLLHGDGSVSVWAPPPAAYGTEVGPDDLMGALESAAGGPFKAVDVACGRYASFVLQSDGTVWSWGSTDCLDELDQCDTRLGWAPGGGESETPAQVMGLTDVIQLSAGGGFTLALQADGKVIGWGNNEYNQLGIGQPDTPFAGVTAVAGDPPVFVEVAAGFDFSLARAADGTVWAWGNDGGFNCRLATNGADPTIPGQVLKEDDTPLTDVVSIAAGAEQGMALTGDGTVYVWGEGQDGAIGLGESWNDADQDPEFNWANRATPIPGLPAIEAIRAGGYRSIGSETPRGAGIDAAGNVYMWGTFVGDLPGAATPQFKPYLLEVAPAKDIFFGWDNTFLLAK